MTAAAPVARQLALLGNDGTPEVPPPRLRTDVAGVTWSYSRRSRLEQCARRYYYQYFGANKRSATDEPDKESLRLLKTLSNRFERSGALLHLAVSTWLRAVQRGEQRDVDDLGRWVVGLFQVDQTMSRRHPDGDWPPLENKYPPVLLREYHYRQSDADELFEDATARLTAALHSFAVSERYAPFRAGATSPNAAIEATIRLRALPCKIDGRVDLAFASGDRVVVVDWKLGGGAATGDESLQLAVYALWAMEHFGCAPDALDVYKAHLLSGELASFRVDPAVLADARARVVQDAERMAGLERYGREGVADAFTPCGHPAVCALCPFQRVCPDGRRLLHA
jgi:hypothetical protein